MSSTTAPRRSSRASTPTTEMRDTPASAVKRAPGSARKSLGRIQSPAPVSARPPLPKKAKNINLTAEGKLHKVKLQTLQLGLDANSGEAQTIMIARVKCPVPKGTPGHIIKRFDTDAVSASSMFRAAFPGATEAEEITEMNWVANLSRGRYGDTTAGGAEDDSMRKLSGTWVPVAKAALLAGEYGILRYASDLISHAATASTVTAEIPDSEVDSPVAARTTGTKRQRVTSPSALSSVPASISQTVDQQQIDEAKAIVESVKQEKATVVITVEKVTVSKKRGIAAVKVEEDYPVAAPVEDVVVDERGFFGKIFKRAPKRVEVIAAREVQGAMVAQEEREGRRWIAGFGIAVAVGATAAVPYLLG